MKFEDSLKARLNIVNPTVRDVSAPQNSYISEFQKLICVHVVS